jgi:hypothetical protein
MPVTIRTATPEIDFPAIAELISQVDPPVIAADLHKWEGRQFEGQIRRRSVAIDRHIFESQLTPADFDVNRFAGVVAAVKATGIHFFSLAELEFMFRDNAT